MNVTKSNKRVCQVVTIGTHDFEVPRNVEHFETGIVGGFRMVMKLASVPIPEFNQCQVAVIDTVTEQNGRKAMYVTARDLAHSIVGNSEFHPNL